MNVPTPLSDWIARHWPLALTVLAFLSAYAACLASAWAAARPRALAFAERRRRVRALERRLKPGQPVPPSVAAAREALARERARLVDAGLLR